MINNKSIEFEVIQDVSGSYTAGCFSERLFVEAKTLEQLNDNIWSAIVGHFPEDRRPEPSAIRLILFREKQLG